MRSPEEWLDNLEWSKKNIFMAAALAYVALAFLVVWWNR